MALRLHDLGLCPIPFGDTDGKTPLIKTAKWRARPSWKRVADLTQRPAFRSANIGILTGFSGVTILDIDDADHAEALTDLFGASPLVTATPSGGFHLWYRSSGERCANLRSAGYAADVKGIGGYLVVPPSVRPSGEHAGVAYELVTGSWESLQDLRPIRKAGQDLLRRQSPALPQVSATPRSPDRRGMIREGDRNNALFREAVQIADTADSPEQLLEEMQALNDIRCEPPLANAEVERLARSAWRYKTEDRLFTSREPGFACPYDLVARIGEPDAFWLFLHLRLYHASKIVSGESFAIAALAMAQARSIPRLGERAIRTARDRLLAAGVLVEVKHGGRGPGDASRYAFAPPKPASIT